MVTTKDLVTQNETIPSLADSDSPEEAFIKIRFQFSVYEILIVHMKKGTKNPYENIVLCTSRLIRRSESISWITTCWSGEEIATQGHVYAHCNNF